MKHSSQKSHFKRNLLFVGQRSKINSVVKSTGVEIIRPHTKFYISIEMPGFLQQKFGEQQ